MAAAHPTPLQAPVKGCEVGRGSLWGCSYVDHGRELLPHVGPVGVGPVGVGAVVEHGEPCPHQVGSAAKGGTWPWLMPLSPLHPLRDPSAGTAFGLAANPCCCTPPLLTFPLFSDFLRFKESLNWGVIGCCHRGDPQHCCVAAGSAGWDLPGSFSSHDLSAGRNRPSLFSPLSPPPLLRSDTALGDAELSLQSASATAWDSL